MKLETKHLAFGWVPSYLLMGTKWGDQTNLSMSLFSSRKKTEDTNIVLFFSSMLCPLHRRFCSFSHCLHAPLDLTLIGFSSATSSPLSSLWAAPSLYALFNSPPWLQHPRCLCSLCYIYCTMLPPVPSRLPLCCDSLQPLYHPGLYNVSALLYRNLFILGGGTELKQ